MANDVFDTSVREAGAALMESRHRLARALDDLSQVRAIAQWVDGDVTATSQALGEARGLTAYPSAETAVERNTKAVRELDRARDEGRSVADHLDRASERMVTARTLLDVAATQTEGVSEEDRQVLATAREATTRSMTQVGNASRSLQTMRESLAEGRGYLSTRTADPTTARAVSASGRVQVELGLEDAIVAEEGVGEARVAAGRASDGLSELERTLDRMAGEHVDGSARRARRDDAARHDRRPEPPAERGRRI